MTKYSQALIDFYTKDGRKPIFIERSFEITEETPIEDILYTYNEMACRGYLIEEQGIFLENAAHFSKKPTFCFLYLSVIGDTKRTGILLFSSATILTTACVVSKPAGISL